MNFKKVLGMLIAVVVIFFLLNSFLMSVSFSGEKSIVIPNGTGTTKIAKELKAQQLIRNEAFFLMYAKLHGYEKNLKAGTYVFKSPLSIKDILTTLADGQESFTAVTIPEGFNITQIADTLAKKELIDKERFLDLIQKNEFDYSFIPKNTDLKYPLEGYLYPDTYRIIKGMTEEDIINMMLKRFGQVMEKEFAEKKDVLKNDMSDIIILASIIEKEAKFPEDRELIASVFYNRLEIGQKLESCATVQFLLDTPKARLSGKDLQIKSPYNTYQHQGLPPGPICSPGKEAIKAALYPAKTDYKFFLAKPDGASFFSKTFAEHNAAIKKYLD